jgi:hypothetical protein
VAEYKEAAPLCENSSDFRKGAIRTHFHQGTIGEGAIPWNCAWDAAAEKGTAFQQGG